MATDEIGAMLVPFIEYKENVMRPVSLIVFLLGLALAMPALAGSASITDGRGNWQSTKCMQPKPPAAMMHDPEAAADSLNERINQHNQYVAEAQAYMNCVSQEAQADANAAGQVITSAAQALIQQMQSQVSASAGLLQK